MGKSSIILQFTDRKFDPKTDFTVGVEFGAKVMTLASVRCNPTANATQLPSPLGPAIPSLADLIRNSVQGKRVKFQLWDTVRLMRICDASAFSLIFCVTLY